jgi:hypothetical protein
MILPETYVIQKLLSYSHNPTYHKYNKTYNAGCPICKEGKSFSKKKRLFYYIDTNTFYCFNCNKHWSALSWIMEAGRLSFREIQKEVSTNCSKIDVSDKIFTNTSKDRSIADKLPHDSINLSDSTQIEYYKNNKFVQKALEIISKRKLNTAINRPDTFYISLTDFVHKNRLCIPFYNSNKDIIFYQTRSLDDSSPKYLNKLSDKHIFGLNNIKNNIDYIFIFEGPIDAMFVENGVAATGLNLTKTQQEELDKFPFHKKIWVLDNQHLDNAAKEKTDKLLDNNLSVFIWPTNIPCKDFNELTILLKQNYISHKFILNNTKLF